MALFGGKHARVAFFGALVLGHLSKPWILAPEATLPQSPLGEQFLSMGREVSDGLGGGGSPSCRDFSRTREIGRAWVS